YGRRIGLAFQIADDLLDLEGDFDALGKTVGADQARGKMTYPAVVGPAQARNMGQELVDQAAAIADGLGPQAAPLAELARYIMARTH
ncbi:MAG: polyprenyl synthetase family protein, partial [Desulfarculaceae bacterium]|nr:polyprenyl synthetase family protein [Desulfarculaceae bacterium]